MTAFLFVLSGFYLGGAFIIVLDAKIRDQKLGAEEIASALAWPIIIVGVLAFGDDARRRFGIDPRGEQFAALSRLIDMQDKALGEQDKMITTMHEEMASQFNLSQAYVAVVEERHAHYRQAVLLTAMTLPEICGCRETMLDTVLIADVGEKDRSPVDPVADDEKKVEERAP